ncbi:MAG: hypothetical protein ACK532_08775 [Acidobacteriota bacterium]
MTKTTTFRHFLSFVFGPLFVKGRWFFWILGLLLLMMVGNVITAIRMEIPSIENVHRIKGKFVDLHKGYSKGVLFSIGIVDDSGKVHQCNCEPLGDSNCLGRKPSDYADIQDQLDPELLKRYDPQKAIVRWLKKKDGELWMYPNRSFFGNPNSCYQISTGPHTLLSFEWSFQQYSRAKNGINVYLFWLYTVFLTVVLLLYLIVRVSSYFEGIKNGKPRS